MACPRTSPATRGARKGQVACTVASFDVRAHRVWQPSGLIATAGPSNASMKVEHCKRLPSTCEPYDSGGSLWSAGGRAPARLASFAPYGSCFSSLRASASGHCPFRRRTAKCGAKMRGSWLLSPPLVAALLPASFTNLCQAQGITADKIRVERRNKLEPLATATTVTTET